MNFGKPTHVKGRYTENDDLMAKEFYWLCYRKHRTFAEMKIWHHAFMEMHLQRQIDEEEASEWFMRGLRYFDMQASRHISCSKGRRAETQLKSLERSGDYLQLDEADNKVIERAKMIHAVRHAVINAVEEKQNKVEPCKVSQQITITIQGQDYIARIPL